MAHKMAHKRIILALHSLFGYNTDMIWSITSLLSDPLGTLKQLACMLPVILLSLTLHEWGHAYAAYKCGDPTAYNLGRMTLNPFAHIDPIGFVSMLLFGFGWAKPVPVNSRNYRNYKKGEAIVSLAGVFMNLVLVFAFSALTLFFWYLGTKMDAEWLDSDVLWTVLTYGIMINVVLMLFNLIPLYPLDGYHVFELIFARRLPAKVFFFLRRYGQFILIGLLVVMHFVGFSPASQLTMLILRGLSALARLWFA